MANAWLRQVGTAQFGSGIRAVAPSSCVTQAIRRKCMPFRGARTVAGSLPAEMIVSSESGIPPMEQIAARCPDTKTQLPDYRGTKTADCLHRRLTIVQSAFGTLKQRWKRVF